VRRGLAFIMEGDYAGTPQGDVQYIRNVMGITQACQETQNYDVLFALLSKSMVFNLYNSLKLILLDPRLQELPKRMEPGMDGSQIINVSMLTVIF